MATSPLANTLRRSLLIKIISKQTPSKADVASVIELTAAKVVEALRAQSMTFYLLEGNEITFKQVYYSPSLWADKPAKQQEFDELQAKLLQLKLPLGKGVVGKVIASGEPDFFQGNSNRALMADLAQSTRFTVHSMLTVPLKPRSPSARSKFSTKNSKTVAAANFPRVTWRC